MSADNFSDPSARVFLDEATHAALRAQIESARARGWTNNDLKAFFYAQGVTQGHARQAYNGEAIDQASLAALVRICSEGIPENPSGQAPDDLMPDRAMLDEFRTRVFRNADPASFINLRAFHDKRAGERPLCLEGVQVGSPSVPDRVFARAAEAANAPEPHVFCPPVATFKGSRSASEQDLADGVCLSVECDQNAAEALRILRDPLGEPTAIVASGGRWNNPDSGEPEDKLHLHWRLAVPARTPQEHRNLKRARALATRLVGGDASNMPAVHPIRWPGSWHRKNAPRMATLIGGDPEAEIDLDEAFVSLMDAIGTAETEDDDPAGHTPNDDLSGEINDVAAALAVIPNVDLDWVKWNYIGMAAYAATGGRGFEAFDEWSAKSSKYDPEATRARWAHYSKSPPTRIGAGTLFFLAREAQPGWRKPSSWRFESETRHGRGASAGAAAADPESVAAAGPAEFSEDAVARLFAERHEGKLRFDHHRGRWFTWDGARWRLDEIELAFQRVRELALEEGERHGARALKEATRLRFSTHVSAFARGDSRLAVTSDGWDRDDWLLGTPTGTVDLVTGLLRPADPVEGITMLTRVAPASEALCPRWRQFINEVTKGEPGYARFLQQMAGYALTGSTREHALFFAHGPGGNGKGVFINTLNYILGDYAVTAGMETFVASTHDRHPTELARLRGARLVSASETEEGRAWAEARIKALTGGDRIAARFMQRDFFEFQPAFKLLIIGNFAPVLRNVDEAARRRFNLLPFNFAPPEKDRLLEDKLRAEAPGILRWMVEGCLDWQANGLVRPDAVKAATSDYFETQDMLGQFLEEECDVEPSNQWKTVPAGKLFEAWSTYAKARGEHPGSQKGLNGTLQKRGLFTKRGTGGVRTVVGIRLNAEYGDARTRA